MHDSGAQLLHPKIEIKFEVQQGGVSVLHGERCREWWRGEGCREWWRGEKWEDILVITVTKQAQVVRNSY